MPYKGLQKDMVRKALKLFLLPIERILFERAKNLKIGSLQKTVHIVRGDTIGDFVLFSAVLPYFKKIYPGYKIVLIGDAVWKELALWLKENKILGGGRSFDELIAVDGKKYNRNPFYYYKILKKIRLGAPEIVVQTTFSRTEKSDRWVLVSKESLKIGYEGDLSNIKAWPKAKNDTEYNRLIKNPESGLETKRNKHFLNELAGCEILKSGLPEWRVGEGLKMEGRSFLKSIGVDASKPIVIVCPNGSERKRSWTRENFVSLTLKLHKYDDSFQFVLTGGQRDQADCLKIQETLKSKGLRAHNICAKTSLPELAEILSVSNVYIGAETGSMHMASAIGIPIVVLRWEGHYERFFPYPAWKPGSQNIVVLQKRDESDGAIKIKEAFNRIMVILKNEQK